MMSHPAWVCGLKPVSKEYSCFTKVTPCVGVWIETLDKTCTSVLNMSHPAWVCGLKLNRWLNALSKSKSHPAWVCGLKPVLSSPSFGTRQVTPCVGVWIETNLESVHHQYGKSHPAWVCGLKLNMYGLQYRSNRSHTLRGCVD